MKIRISKENKSRIEDVIKKIQARQSARLITADDVISWTHAIEKKLLTLMPKKHHVGAVAGIDEHAQSFPNAYKYTPMSTSFRIERCSSGWFLTDVKRSVCNSPSYRVNIKLSDDQKKIIAEHVIQYKNW